MRGGKREGGEGKESEELVSVKDREIERERNPEVAEGKVVVVNGQ